MKIFKFFIFLLLINCFNNVLAQPFGNEWINYQRYYYKIKITNEGIYRINYNTLISAGIPINTIDPRLMQIYHNGEEQYIYIHGENDGSLIVTTL